MAEVRKKASPLKALKRDDSIMGTNNSSIASKRSVERLYYHDEPHFFRYFVKRPQRRAPLINRGYWLRMKAIEHVVYQFLREPSEKQKIIMNLGCGYDPNPWQYLARYPEVCKTVKFIDVDYMLLMIKKRDVVKSTTELNGMLTNLSFPEHSQILLRSDQYLQVGCDLRDLSKLSAALTSALDMEKCLVLFTAEASITYMDIEAADALIKWASTAPDARFCLLEQLLPEGPDHPFAKTMMAHFEKLQTPLRAVSQYPTTSDQEARFKTAGWTYVWAQNLWELWGSPDFLTSAQRRALDVVEPFDEWEEFALFSMHYFLLFASNATHCEPPRPKTSRHGRSENLTVESVSASMVYAEYSKLCGCRRYAAPLPVRGLNRQRDLVGNFAGMGLNTRLSSYDAYTPSAVTDQLFYNHSPLQVPSARMCHTLTDLGDAGALLVGGRTSPNNALEDCWLYHKWTNTWERVDDLPGPRYRHSAVVVGGNSVLVAGGKSDSRTILKDVLLWSRRLGWAKCVSDPAGRVVTESESTRPKPHSSDGPVIFGAILATSSTDSSRNCSITGILAGGISQDSLISEDVWFWTLGSYDETEPSISFEKSGPPGAVLGMRSDSVIARFGANVIRHAGRLLVVGGVARDFMLTADEDIILLDVIGSGANSRGISINTIHIKDPNPRPLLIGSSISSSGNSVIIMGGGAVCFSFGTFLNNGCSSLCLEEFAGRTHHEFCQRGQTEASRGPILEKWRYLQTVEYTPKKSTNSVDGALATNTKRAVDVVSVPRRKVTSVADFSVIVSAARPVILEELDLGNCTKKWTSGYLKDRIGYNNKVVVHQASTSHMDFISKNFRYTTKPFGEFMEAVDNGEKLYLRSLSAEEPSKIPANLEKDFPTIADDFQLPPELRMVTESAHSSPLRISGPVNMWLHYDVMANVLCQIRGSKRVLLFPPCDFQYLHFSPGSSSSSVDVFSMLDDVELAHTHPHEVTLHPGDVLFVPALWLHTASPIEGVSVAVNVFFRNLYCGYAVGKDVYGNRDLQVYERGRQDVARIAKSFSSLPADVRSFYLQRLAEELREMAGPDEFDL